MQIYNGKGVSGGIAIGRIRVYKKRGQEINCISVTDTDKELIRFRDAKKEASRQLDILYEKALKDLGEENAAIFEAHQMILEDVDFNESVEAIVQSQNVNIEYAVFETGKKIAEIFAQMDDSYMKERAADVKDVSERLLNILKGASDEIVISDEPVIIAARELAPSETIQLDKSKVLSFVTTLGSSNSHTAILARMMAIPAVARVELPLDDSIDGRLGIVDGEAGLIYVEPDEETCKEMQLKKQQEHQKHKMLQQLRGKESITSDGQKVMLYANIGSVEDIDAAVRNDAEGVGLFRTEFIYMEKEDYPTEEEQFQIYKQAAEKMEGRRIIIRTLDIGADKKCDYFGMEQEENPALGCRAIRICLMRPEIFETQLRALYRASNYGKIAIMYPMITSIKEIRRIKEIVSKVKAELKAEGIPYGNLEQGIMIETPAAVFISKELAREVDFFSIGTNDLTQYALAIDRQNTKLDEFYDAHHPAVLRMISMVVENAHQAGIWVGICGELGADPQLTKEFLAMEVDELSMSPESILQIRKIIRETNVREYKMKK
ncbi:MAG: phosphoenolpyruvate--protein phosphotransferase [Dorea sp.]|nr:phosphoenolpyruvate--protein phosphotransferase [Dorea sp.]